MKLTKDTYSKIRAEIEQPYRTKIKKEISQAQKAFEVGLSYYLTSDELKTVYKIPNGYLLPVTSVFIPKKFVTKMHVLTKKNIRLPWNSISKSYKDDGVEIELTNKIEIPYFLLKDCGCRQYHAVVIKPCNDLLDPIIDLCIQYDELIDVINNAENSFKTLKTLKQGLIGIEKIAPKTIAELEKGINMGALVLATDVSKYALGTE